MQTKDSRENCRVKFFRTSSRGPVLGRYVRCLVFQVYIFFYLGQASDRNGDTVRGEHDVEEAMYNELTAIMWKVLLLLELRKI